MNWTTLLAWVMDPIRTLDELRQAHIALLGHPNMGNRVQVRAPVRNHINSMIATHGGAAAAPWHPGMGVPVLPVIPVPPVPVPPTPVLPVVPPPPATPLSIVTAALAGATEGTTLTEVFQAAGGIPGYTWSSVIGLPAFLTLNANGILSGNPAAGDVGNHAFIIRVTDASGNHVEGNFTLSVAAAAPAPVPPAPPALSIVTGALPNARRGMPYTADLVAANGTGPFTWTVRGLPLRGRIRNRRGFVVNAATGQITANRVPDDMAPTTNLDVTVEDSTGATANATIPLRATGALATTTMDGAWLMPVAAILGGVIGLFLLALGGYWLWDHTVGDNGSDNGTQVTKQPSTGNGNSSGNGDDTSSQPGAKKALTEDGSGNATVANVTSWNVPAPPSTDLNNDGFTKKTIDNASQNVWNHRVIDPSIFDAAHNWAGADSWFNTLMVGPNSGGFWTSQGNSGEVVYRGTNNHVSWCLADLTTSSWNGINLKAQFLSRGNPSLPAQMSIKQLTPGSIVAVKTHTGEIKHQAASDIGDITIELPDNGVTSVCIDITTAAPTAEQFVKFGPLDRTDNIDIIDAR